MLTIDPQKSGDFTLQANNSQGFEVVNGAKNSPIIVRITATGMWKVNTEKPLPSCDADGLPQEDAGTIGFKMPEAKAGSLLLHRKQSNYYQRIGTVADIILYPGETVAFVCNDAEGGFNDNEGFLNIKWELVV